MAFGNSTGFELSLQNVKYRQTEEVDIQTIHDDISAMSNNAYKRFFKGTSFERSGKRGLLKNLKLYLSQSYLE